MPVATQVTAPKHVASASIRINGTLMAKEQMDAVEKIEVRCQRNLPDMASIRLTDPKGELVKAPPFKIGDAIELRLGALEATQPDPVFVGEIVAYEPDFSVQSATLSFRALDTLHRMQNGRKSRTFLKMTLNAVVQKIVGENGLATGKLDATTITHDHLQQSAETDLDFLNRIAASEGMEFGVSAGKAVLHAVSAGTPGSSAAPTAKWLENVQSFRPRLSGTQQPGKVRVMGWDPVQKRAIVGEASTPTPGAPTVAQARQEALKAFSGAKPELVISNRVVTSQGEATKLAQGALDRLAGGALEAEGAIEGDPAVKPGGQIKLEGFGPTFDGLHFVSSVTHVYGHGGFKTKFVISGSNPRTMMDAMRPKQQSGGFGGTGLVIGIVTNTNDPDGRGRVKVKLPQLGDAIESEWARIACPGAGNQAGLLFRPMVDDEVVVGFENGDTRRPVVLGGLHNGKDKPPKDKDVNGNERAGDEGANSLLAFGRGDAHLKFSNKLVMDSRGSAEINVTKRSGAGEGPGAGNFKVKTEDKIELEAGQSITISAPKSGDVTLKAAAGGLTVESGSGNVTVKGVSVTVEASASLKLKGATVDVEGSGPVNIRGAIVNLG